MSPGLPPEAFLSRELSWLEFNSRVLEEAQDLRNPLLERLRFFCIFHSNLDEFFMVRVASLMRRVRDGKNRPDPAGLTPFRQLAMVKGRVRELEQKSYRLLHQGLLVPLREQGIRILEVDDVEPHQQAFLDQYFEKEVYPIVTPLAVNPAKPFPHLNNLALYLAVLITPEDGKGTERKVALIQIPSGLAGLVKLPDGDGISMCWLSDLVRTRAEKLFLGYRILDAGGFRLTRDAEFELDDEGSYDYVRMLESELEGRRTARPIVLKVEFRMGSELREYLRKGLQIEKAELIRVKGPVEPKALVSLVNLPGFDSLRFHPQPPLMPNVFEQDRSIFEIIRDGDILLHHPYDSFDPLVELVRAAAEDPDVLAIKQILYRTSGKDSPVLKGLINAAENGKEVTALLELTARFDEERNIGWAKDLEAAGAHVLYGIVGLKVHAKIALVVRREPDGIRRYVHLGTGNYNEQTSRLYTDYGLLTAVDEFGADASGFFNAITGYSESPPYQRILVAPLGLRDAIVSLIRRESDRAKSGQVSGIRAKMNSLLDPAIIQELYTASSMGVPIQLNVRGICALRPGVSGLSENIRVVSILDRYLEHSRAFHFRNGGQDEVYLSSADWMPRNLDRRVEIMFPLVQQDTLETVIDGLDAQFRDNQKARLLKPDGSYRRATAGRNDPLQVQEYLYQRHVEVQNRLRSAAPLSLVPIENRERKG